MNFMESKNIIIIYGGRVDKEGYTSYHCFSDICILNLEKIAWGHVKIHGQIPPARNAHCTGVIGSKLVIFGGITAGQHADSTTYFIDFD